MSGNFKVKCIKDDYGWLTKGKVYKFENGTITYDGGFKPCTEYKSIAQYKRENPGLGECVELVEEEKSTGGNFKVADGVKQGKNNVKIGDTIEVLASVHKQNNYKIGSFQKVVNIEKDGCPRIKGGNTVWDVVTEEFEIINSASELSPYITIHRNGRDTIATLKNDNTVIKTAKATCNPLDEFVDEIGQKLAFERLMGCGIGKVSKVKETSTFNWDGFNDGKFVVHCDTEEKAKEFFEGCKSQGIKWCSGKQLESEKTFWNCYEASTCYWNEDGEGLCYSPNDYYKDECGLDVIDYISTKELLKEELKNKDGNFKAKCIKTKDCALTEGKIYEFKNGHSQFDSGTTIPTETRKGISRFRNFADLKVWFAESGMSEFEEVIETAIKPVDLTAEVLTPTIRIIKQARYEVGDKVKLVSVRPSHRNDDGEMDKYLGNEVTITEVSAYKEFRFENDRGWTFLFSEIEGKVIEDTVKEVKRQVNPDEYVKIINASAVPTTDGKPDYKNGDIIKIIGGGYQAKYAEGTGDNRCIRVLNPSEYVVLENYQPEEITIKKVNRQAKVGEWIEVVKLDRRHNPVVEIGDILLIDHMTFGKPATAKGNNFEQSEYVVLENYTPPTPDPKVETKSEPSIKPLSDWTQTELITELFNRITN